MSVIGGAASAATAKCGDALAALVTGTSDCEISSTANQDFLNTTPITVNGEAFFGFTDWVYLDKDEGVDVDDETVYSNPEVSSTNYLSVNGDGTSGTWAIWEGLASMYSDGMLIFKDGNDTFLTGYLLSGFTGLYGDVFDGKDISHVTLYGRGVGQEIPLPAAGWLLLGGLGGLVAMKRRKS
ncbi:VPLPA-CTERM sorting domain-containing protein [Alphaproteobacteria bacterium GH1-50]|uniref:VPLPA-CTERM sorting domain-containing protein n=1 Tax=Kangsaoukella pontilimi TaxID=2691042 RepID=A0A7C9IFN0_9RHOB|nr:VPLPA-CTERM sorting domain-containing protein [Kangsaoukella pontilimi]MXQ07684.1 VPLPA-CTERM sorting domain-containing protein [Kangsaoukella pontilimi]